MKRCITKLTPARRGPFFLFVLVGVSVSGWHGWQPGHGEDHLERGRAGGPVCRCVSDAVDEGSEVCLEVWC